ncbi:MAG: polymer-forming cytoskeletal protein [Cyanobacteriota bacterium]|nr:polymer-forming cytoskeletal protein [Cyanobacteriota bacterium]
MFGRKSAPLLTYLGQRTEFEGLLNAEGIVRVDGILHGTVNVAGRLEVSRTGLIESDAVNAHDMVVQGVVKATKITVKDKLTLTRTARIEGDITAGSIEIEPGAYYMGYIQTHETQAQPAFLPSSRPVAELYGNPEG